MRVSGELVKAVKEQHAAGVTVALIAGNLLASVGAMRSINTVVDILMDKYEPAEKELVIAGHGGQYEEWLRRGRRNPGHYRYISKEQDLRGLPEGTVIRLVGTHWESRARGELLDHLERLGRVTIIEE